jgi:predicted nucleotidyltransferase component of viral defense system
MPDIAVSVIAQLKNKAIKTGKPLQLYLQLFCQEEFLRRLSLSKYSNNLILKGGMLIYTLTKFESRATVDIDFLLHQVPGDMETVRQMVDEIIATDSGNTYIQLSSGSFESTSPQRKYQGISFQLIGKIKNTKAPFNVDIGIGDVIVPKPLKRAIPVQLEGFAAPEVVTYSLESTIAEKFDAILQRLELTSRMKDIYDIYYLSNQFDFYGLMLQQAIHKSLTNRGTPFGFDSLEKVIALGQDNNIQVRWRQFLKRTGLSELSLNQALSGINTFLSPVWEALIRNKDFNGFWNAEVNEWKAK